MVITRIPRILINFVISRMDHRFYIKIYLHELMIRQLVEFERQAGRIVHFTVVCLVAKPLNRNEAEGDLVMIQTLLLFKQKLLCYHAN